MGAPLGPYIATGLSAEDGVHPCLRRVAPPSDQVRQRAAWFLDAEPLRNVTGARLRLGIGSETGWLRIAHKKGCLDNAVNRRAAFRAGPCPSQPHRPAVRAAPGGRITAFREIGKMRGWLGGDKCGRVLGGRRGQLLVPGERPLIAQNSPSTPGG